ncbi:TetR family transcriptional regulator [Glaciihabitans tibetensis]|uniref:TetR family transcriptional regulator n=1 Tax=Glaciihabitans tibetensis TaxID=1266600 RepID=A0A2T0VCE5_9MICO|nr:TetR/AcrR family transcriptional regulator [Glaciihabitans tibetensis]PRY67853.1 TetR family transcriptional regulator [Glaciihabitans tibetensis]
MSESLGVSARLRAPGRADGGAGTAERNRLLDLVVDRILDETMIQMSLSGIARSIGSNNRMLLYYFGSREDLLDEAAVRAFERFPRLRDLFVRFSEPGGLEGRLIRAWEDLSAPEHLPYLRLYFQQLGIAIHATHAWAPFMTRSATQWLDLLAGQLRRDGYGEERSRTAAIEILSLWRGLQILLLTGLSVDELTLAYAARVRTLVEELDAIRTPGATRD